MGSTSRTLAVRHQRRPNKPTRPRRCVLALQHLEDRTLLSFAATIATNLGAFPNAVAVGHFEGANFPLDVVTANQNGTVSVLLGNGDGTLQSPVNYALGTTPEAVAVGDLRDNGLSDVVTANLNGTVSVLLSNGDGSFRSPISIPVGAVPDAVAVGDLRGDGHLDIVTGNINGTVSVLLGNGDGSFQSALVTPVGKRLASVAIGHFTSNGPADLAVADLGDYPLEINGDVAILRGNGDGTFQSPVSFFTNTVPFSVAVGDVRGDGHQDVAVDVNDEVALLLGNGDGSFQNPVVLNNGGRPVTSVVMGDFNGDGKSDILTVNLRQDYNGGNASFSVLLSNGDGTFQTPRFADAAAGSVVVALGDFVGNGQVGVVQANATNGVSVLLGHGDGTLATTPAYRALGLPEMLAAGDLTGSGKQDLVVTGRAGQPIILFNNGDGTFRSGPTLPVSGPSGAVAIGDLTGNGNQDLVISEPGNFGEAGRIKVFLGNGDGTFRDPLITNVATNAFVEALLLTDLTGDGTLDLIALYEVQNQDFVETFIGNRDGTFAPAATVPVLNGSTGLAVGDLFGHGKQDVVVGNSVDGNVSLLRGNGDGTLQAPLVLHVGNDARAVAVGDLGNGHQDIAVTDARSSTVNVVLGNGDGTFHNPVAYSAGRGVALVVGDFFGDGNLGLAVDNSDANTVSVLRGNGDGTFQSAVNYLVGAQSSDPAALVAGDFLGHGAIDLAATNFVSDDVSVLLNQTSSPTATSGNLSRAVTPAAVDTLFASARLDAASHGMDRPPAVAVFDPTFFISRLEAVTQPSARHVAAAAGILRYLDGTAAEMTDRAGLADPLAEAR
jgi:hypothetical protein